MTPQAMAITPPKSAQVIQPESAGTMAGVFSRETPNPAATNTNTQRKSNETHDG